MASQLQFLLDELYSGVRGQIMILICETLSYGIYLCLAPIAIHAMVINGLQSRARKWLFVITAIILGLTTVLWIISIIFTFQFIDSYDDMVTVCYGNVNAFHCLRSKLPDTYLPVASWLAMFSNMLFVNYIIADGVVVWRAWVLCSDQSRVVLMIPVVMLAINTVAYLITVTARVIEVISKDADSMYLHLENIIYVTQVAHIMLSLLVNIFATSIIAHKAWKYRKLLMDHGIGIRNPSQAIRILILLIESGMIYILIGVTSMVLMGISMRFGLDMVFGLSKVVGIQLAGIYPIVVVILVEKNRSLDTTFCSFGTVIDVRGDRLSRVEPMTFASGPLSASGGQIDSAAKPPSSSTYVTFDYSLEPRDAGIGGKISKVSSEEHVA